MKPKRITFELVTSEIQKLHLAGEKITVRNVLARTGGDAGTISSYIKKWLNQRKVINSYSISDTLMSACIAEVNVAVNKALEAKEYELSQAYLLNEELGSINSELESKITNYDEQKQQFIAIQERATMLDNELKVLRQQYDKSVAKAAVLTKNLADVKNELLKAKKQLHEANDTKQKALKDLAISQAKEEQLQKQLNNLFTKFKVK